MHCNCNGDRQHVRRPSGGGGAAAYPSPAEGRGSIYVEAISGTAAAYAPTGGAGGADDGALYTNDAYGSVAGSTA